MNNKKANAPKVLHSADIHVLYRAISKQWIRKDVAGSDRDLI